jgi:hypothetical protein
MFASFMIEWGKEIKNWIGYIKKLDRSFFDTNALI